MKTFREFITEVYDPDVVGNHKFVSKAKVVGRSYGKQSEPEEKNESSWWW